MNIPFVIDNQQHNMVEVLAIQEIALLISIDVLSEGQNLQDCDVLINSDLHWNPTRMVQLAERIDRIGTSFEILWVMNLFPDDGAEKREGV